MRTISLKLPDHLLQQLESEAKARRVTKSWLIRESLETTFRQSRFGLASCYDLANDLAGAVKGLPKDIAENPRYMKDFGKKQQRARYHPLVRRLASPYAALSQTAHVFEWPHQIPEAGNR
ncbi:MAG TPA: CopG family transcriptional regulator [Bryobacteraceae bacterium]|nr:CopG family transcriptional regulator [Bryobacteraceae bacterium]